MRNLINELDHLCSVKEFSNIGSTQILRDESRSFNYEVEVEREQGNVFLFKLPLVKAVQINTRDLLSELQSQIISRCNTPKDDENDESFEDVLKYFSKDLAGKSLGDMKYLFLSMPHHPEKEFHDCSDQLCTLRLNSFELSLDFDQIDVALYADAPINIFFLSVFSALISSSCGLYISSLSFRFQNSYILKENLPKIAKVIEIDEELSTVSVKIKKPINDFRNINEESVEIRIL